MPIDLSSLFAAVTTAFNSKVGQDVIIVVVLLYLGLRFYDAYIGPVTNKYLAGIMGVFTGTLKYIFAKLMELGTFLKSFEANKPTDPPAS